jgi:rfaE bifunctional protein nucleotidyltransferase chain/domain
MLTKLEIIQQKILLLPALMHKVNGWKKMNKKIVFTNGCFDLLHQGHTTYLNQAADLGDVLVVAINTDASVKKLKGDTRPLQNEYSRALNLAAFAYIDYVILFDEETPENLINAILPDVLAKGGDYTFDTIVGAKQVLANGGEVKTIAIVEGFSTSSIVEKMK